MFQIVKYALLFLNALFRRDTSPKVVFYHDIGTKYTPMGTPEDLFWSHMEYLQEEVVRGSSGEEVVVCSGSGKEVVVCSGSGRKDESTLHSTTTTTNYNSSTLHSTTTTTNYNYPLHTVAFDDGFRGVWDHRDTLRLHGIHPIVFIAVGLVGKPGYLTWDEIRTLQNEYGFDFQCHTWSHQTLIGPVNTDLPVPSDPNFRTDAWYHHELVDSKLELERQLNEAVVVNSGSGRKDESIHHSTTTTTHYNLSPLHSTTTTTHYNLSPLHSTTTTTNYNASLHHPVTSLCFPVGYFSDDVIRRSVAAGYTTLYASFPGNKSNNSTLQLQLFTPTKLIPRILCQSLSLFAFKCVLRGGMNPLRNRYLRRHYIEN